MGFPVDFRKLRNKTEVVMNGGPVGIFVERRVKGRHRDSHNVVTQENTDVRDSKGNQAQISTSIQS